MLCAGRRAAKVLLIAAVAPVRSNSAASVRTLELIDAFSAAQHSVYCASPQLVHCDTPEYECFHLPPNEPDAIEATLARTEPDVVIFDRYYIEEMFGPYVRQQLPGALRVLDLQVPLRTLHWFEWLLRIQCRTCTRCG